MSPSSRPGHLFWRRPISVGHRTWTRNPQAFIRSGWWSGFTAATRNPGAWEARPWFGLMTPFLPTTGRWSSSGGNRPCSEAPSPNRNRQRAAKPRRVIRPGGDARIPVHGGWKPSNCRTSTGGPSRRTPPGCHGSRLFALPRRPANPPASLIYRAFACPARAERCGP